MVSIQLLGDIQATLVPQADSYVPVNKSVAEIKDLSKRKGGFTKTVTIPGSKEHNQIFSYYFNVNLLDGTFDHKKKVQAVLLEDNVPIITGYLQLLQIVKKSASQHTLDQEIVWECTIYDESSSLFQDIGDKLLVGNINSEDDLDISFMNHYLTSAKVVSTFTNTIADGYKYTLPMTSDDKYMLNEFAPAIYAKVIFDQIFTRSGYSYEWTKQNDPEYRFSNLIVPYTGDVIVPTAEDLSLFRADISNTGQSFTHTPTTVGSQTSSAYIPLNIPLETFDPSGSYDTSTSTYTFQILQDIAKLAVDAEITYRIALVNNSGATAYVRKNASGYDPQGWRYAMNVKIFKNGSTSGTMGFADGFQFAQRVDSSFSGPNSIPVGETVILSKTMTKSVINPSIFNVGDILDFRAQVTASNYFGGLPQWADSSSGAINPVSIGIKLYIDSIKINIRPNVAYGYGQLVRMNNILPKKIKQKDFLKGILSHFNLYCDVDPSNDKKIIIKGRDDYYDSGAEKDWSKKLVINQDIKISFSSEESGKRLLLKYKKGDDEVNKGYASQTNEEYGQVDYTFTSDFAKGDQTIEVPWEPSPIFETAFGAHVQSYHGAAPKCGLRLIYDSGTLRPCGNYIIADFATSSGSYIGTTMTQYCYAGHFDDPIVPTWDLNFGICDYYFYNTWQSVTNNTSYALHYSRTVAQIEDGRMLEAYFNLRAYDVEQLKLNDRIWINDAWYNVLELKDYNANKRQPTLVKLITVDPNQKFNRFISRVPFKPSYGDVLLGPIGAVLDDRQNTLNSKPPVATNEIRGINNILTNDGNTTKNYVGGDNNYISGFNNFIRGNDNFIEGNNTTIFGNNIKAEGNDLFIAPNIISGVNYINAGRNEILNPFTSFIPNIISASRDEVRQLGSHSLIQIFKAGRDTIL